MPVDDSPFWCPFWWTLVIRLICTTVTRPLSSLETFRIFSLYYSKALEQGPILSVFFLLGNWWIFSIRWMSPFVISLFIFSFFFFCIYVTSLGTYWKFCILHVTSLTNYTFHQRLVLVMPHPDYKYHFGLWSTFPNCSLNCCWQFTLVTFFGELSWGTCSCFAWGAASRQWLPMWWYESPAPLPQGEKTSGSLFFTVFHKAV